MQRPAFMHSVRKTHEDARKVSLEHAKVALTSFVRSSSKLLLPWLTMTTTAQRQCRCLVFNSH
jgi:hypothetical protein